jgi:ABC-type lipoprotein release transport system permease subunit
VGSAYSAVSRLIRSFLFELIVADPLIYVGCVLVMMLVALLASAIPAMRAASADPIGALRAI